VHGPDRHLEGARDLLRRQPAARLEQQEERDEARRANSLKMTEDGLFVCESRSMTEREDTTTSSNVVELLLREPEIVAWLEPEPVDESDDDYPPRAA
jgi:hypothetical protein